MKKLEERYNITYEFQNLTYSGIQESINTSILAGTPDCDLYQTDLAWAASAVLNGYATDLRDVLPADDPLLTHQDKIVNWGGREQGALRSPPALHRKKNLHFLYLHDILSTSRGTGTPGWSCFSELWVGATQRETTRLLAWEWPERFGGTRPLLRESRGRICIRQAEWYRETLPFRLCAIKEEAVFLLPLSRKKEEHSYEGVTLQSSGN